MSFSSGGVPVCIKLYSEKSPENQVKGKVVLHSEPVF